MDNWQAQYTFWSGFGLPAYNELTSIDESEAEYPYISYQAASGDFEHASAVNASLWYKDESWKAISTKADEIGRAIGEGLTIPVDRGLIWIHKSNSTPFAQPVDSGYTNNQIKRINLIVEIEFLTV